MPGRRKRRDRNAPFGHELFPLVQAVAERRVILLVGGGVSQNLGLPDFKSLVTYIAHDMGFPPGTPVAEYSLIAEAYLVKHAQLGALRSWMDSTWHPPTIRLKNPSCIT